MRRGLTHGAIVLMTVATLLVAIQEPSYADPATTPGMKIVSSDEGGIVQVANTDGVSKQAWLAKFESGLRAGPKRDVSTSTMLSETYGGYLTSNGSVVGPNGGQLSCWGNTDWSYDSGFWDVSIYFRNSYAAIVWYGANPYNANQIYFSLKWWVTGWLLSPSLPPGVGFSITSDSIIWERQISDNYTMSMTRADAVTINSSGGVTGEYFTDQGDMLFGTSWYWVQGD